MSLVADYDSDRSEGICDNPEEFAHNLTRAHGSGVEKKLPPPDFLNTTVKLDLDSNKLPGSVFANPFRQEEENHLHLLEKHVKMTVPQTSYPDEFKICWKFRKGKCHSEKLCPYAHIGSGTTDFEETNDFEPSSSEEKPRSKANKRSGLPQTLEPTKKYMKSYMKQKK